MGLGTPRVGYDWTPEFQCSAEPWCTRSFIGTQGTLNSGTLHQYCFPNVTQYVTLVNGSKEKLFVSFTANGMTKWDNRMIVLASASLDMRLRIVEMYVSGSEGIQEYSLLAGLTHIARENAPILTGTFPNGTVGFPGVG